MSVTKLLTTEPEFKAIIDALLRLEVSRLIQTYASGGADGGVDADFHGCFEGIEGHWVFQYKFVNPTTDQARARGRIKAKLCTGTKSLQPEFANFLNRNIAGYVLITNVDATAQFNDDLRADWKKRSKASFAVWDRSTLDAMLRLHGHLARSQSTLMANRALHDVIIPLWKWSAQIWVIFTRPEGSLYPLDGGFVTSPQSFRRPSLIASLPDPKTQYYVKFYGVPSENTPSWDYARNIEFQNAMHHEIKVKEAIVALGSAWMGVVNTVRENIERSSEWNAVGENLLKQNTVLYLAYITVETAYSSGRTIRSTDVGIEVQANTGGYHLIELGINGDSIIRFMQQQLTILRIDTGKPPTDVQAAYDKLQNALYYWRRDLWYPAEVGIDAPLLHSNDEV